jgi:hypothetical protein
MWPTECDVNVNYRESGVNVTQPDMTFNMHYRVCDVNVAYRMWRQYDHATFNKTYGVCDVNVTYQK